MTLSFLSRAWRAVRGARWRAHKISPPERLDASARTGAIPAYQVIIGTTNWTVNGVNVFSANLARALLQAGVPSHVLLTEDDTDLVMTRETIMPRPAGVPTRDCRSRRSSPPPSRRRPRR